MLTRLYRRTNDGETCLYVATTEPLTEEELRQLVWLKAETFDPAGTATTSFLDGRPAVEIGPRLGVETPFSSNAVAICRAIGLAKIQRIEESRRYDTSGRDAGAILAARLDRMTQDAYASPLTTLEPTTTPVPVRTIPVLRDGQAAIHEANLALGLGMDDWDEALYADLFQRYGRDPTDVELFQIGNANSEHSRHWYFRGQLVIDGVAMPSTLFDIVRAPLLALGDDTVSVLAFKDNAGAIRGHEVLALVSAKPGRPAPFTLAQGTWHITCTAETHNHPTLVAPYPGAETGAGGRIRDNTAAGRGSLPYAGLAGYCVGNLFIPGYRIPGEETGGEEDARYASPLRILVEGSNGVSDYGNRFGEPLIGGFTRTFGQIADGERREFRKPVLYSAGVGRLFAPHAEKRAPLPGMVIVRIGGPAYRIGVGGGSASSMVQGANTADLDFNSVQRGNAEMENRANRVIRACIEMGDANPILSLHDQGAGGPSNVLTELLEPAGGRIHIRRIVLGDRSLSVLEIWSAEYQEGYGLLIAPDRLPEFQAICERERVNCEAVGEITGDGHVTVVDSEDGSTPVRLSLDDILTGIPQKTFLSTRKPRVFAPLALPDGLAVADALHKVLRLPQVGSKGFLVHKVDRSVTGLVARQQCVGPAQIPVADVAVTADGYFNLTGGAAAIGEQPIKMLLDPKAGARMAVGEMLTNMAAARISSLRDIRCRANWMWPAKLPHEGPVLYDAAIAMRDIMLALGIAVDGGKDSLSMAATLDGRTVKSPGELVILGYAPVPDIRQVLTPDVKRPGKSLLGLLDLGGGKNRLGGSSLAQAFGQAGNAPPDADDPIQLRWAFDAVQKMQDEGLIFSYHDRSDGGLIVAALEMCFAANCGAHLESAGGDPLAELFSEELGMLFEYMPGDESAIRDLLEDHGLPFRKLGATTVEPLFAVTRRSEPVFSGTIRDLRDAWEETSFQLELLQTDPECAASERQARIRTDTSAYRFTFRPETTAPAVLRAERKPLVAVLREEGTNGDREMAAAFLAAGCLPVDLTMSDLIAGRATLDGMQGVVFPGGFSFMDVFESGKGWAGVIRFNPELKAMFDRFYDRPDTFSLGVCNGCQLMALLGWIPWRGIPETAQPRFIRNSSGRFESRWARVRIEPSPSVLFRGMEGSVLGVWVAHGEGRLVFPDPSIADRIKEGSLAPLRYTDPAGEPTTIYPWNPNGSPEGFTALTSPDGRHLALMPHPERCFLDWQWAWRSENQRRFDASPWLRMFQNARSWCLEHAT
jgi:phosphoribosylformylglycinamidine synthase